MEVFLQYCKSKLVYANSIKLKGGIHMLNHLWKCFETTGDIATYLEFKEYEKTRSSLLEKRVDET